MTIQSGPAGAPDGADRQGLCHPHPRPPNSATISRRNPPERADRRHGHHLRVPSRSTCAPAH